MKILITGTRGIPANYGGFETYVDNLSYKLSIYPDCSITVVNPHYRNNIGNNLNGVSIKYIFDPEIYFANKYLRGFCTIIYDVLSLVHGCINNYQIILICGYASGPFMLLPIFFGKKVVINPDGFEWKSARWGVLIRSWLFICEFISAKLLTSMIADSPEIGRYFQSKYKCKPMVIPYGANIIESPDFPSMIPPASVYYLAIARLVPETNIPLIIKGFLLSGTNKLLFIVGPIKDNKFFDSEIKPLINNVNVIYLGAIYESGAVPSLRFHATALLHGHASDGTNPSLIESMGASSVVLAIDRPSNRAPLGNYYDVYFKDAASLAEKIKWLESQPHSFINKIKSENKKIILDMYSWDTRVKQHYDFLKELI